MRRFAVSACVALVAVLAIWSSGDAAPVRNGPPPGLTRHGRLLWNFEALLHQTFKDRGVSVSRPENFSCSGECAPLSTYRLYRFTFARATGSSFHVSKRTFGDNGEFGNYPIPVLIRGRAVACSANETRFLIAYRSTASFTLECLPKSAAAAFLVGSTAAAASAVRNPTVEEQGAIRQTIFDDIAAKGSPTHPVITRVRVSTAVLPAGGSRYRKFARVDLNDPKAGYAAALLGYYVASISGWRVLDLGSSEVGCSVPSRVFHAEKNAVLRDLRLDCP